MLSTHAQRLERWLGTAPVERLSRDMKDWYGPPIAVSVPGNVWALPGGDFRGPLHAGHLASSADYVADRARRLVRRFGRRQLSTTSMGFASLADLFSEVVKSGKRQEVPFHKVGQATTATLPYLSLWSAGAIPEAGGAASAAPGGRACSNATTGANTGLPDVSPDTRHIVGGKCLLSGTGPAPVNLLVYDRIFDVAKTMSSTTTESVTGVPTRYQGSTRSNPDSATGNFCFVEVLAGTGATAHNWTVCQYRDNIGIDAQSFPSIAGITNNVAGAVDHASWFMPLSTGDTGVMDLHQMQCSASVTGTVNFVIGHPLMWMPCPLANCLFRFDGILTSFNLVRVFDGAALAFMEANRTSSFTNDYAGSLQFAHG
jgi:hypothetical protein